MSPDRRAPADAHLPSHIITSFARRNAVERNATVCCTWRRRSTLEAFMQLFPPFFWLNKWTPPHPERFLPVGRIPFRGSAVSHTELDLSHIHMDSQLNAP